MYANVSETEDNDAYSCKCPRGQSAILDGHSNLLVSLPEEKQWFS
jgi:hypothetical protein